LIPEAGIAGLTTAHWLRRYGFVPTIVERAESIARPRAHDPRHAELQVVHIRVPRANG
jgi:2-polyprenyl-6-methoxyphenol hydroxylase-like FAD-dependent oxidoreductase